MVFGDTAPVLTGLAGMLREQDMWLELVRGDQTETFAGLMNDLRRKFDADGDGKRITSCYAYMGVEPAIAWVTACRDLLYPLMRHGIESFGQRWRDVRAGLAATPHHYVSLGPGDGQKDDVILADLRRDSDLRYVPVDASTEMLRLAISELTRRNTLPTDRILSLSWDFAVRDNLAALRRLLDDRPVLFSLLGNTLANFDADADLLRLLSTELLRPADRLLLEVATAPALTEDAAALAAAEYEASPAFGEFLTSALRRYTDLRVDHDSVEHVGRVEGARALRVTMTYRNRTGRDIPITLPDRACVRFAPNDTIRLALSRKYSMAGLETMLAGAGLTVTAASRPCGRALLMLATEPDATSAGTLANHVWRL
jgi:L-histidine N-alpha-methyltransferase